MSIHTSLRKKGFSKGHRNILKRFERVKKLIAKGSWSEESSILGMEKIKSIKLKKK